MNQRGGIFDNIIVFLGLLLLIGLYINNIESVLLQSVASSNTSGIGTDTYILLAGSAVLLLLFALVQLTKQPDSLSFG